MLTGRSSRDRFVQVGSPVERGEYTNSRYMVVAFLDDHPWFVGRDFTPWMCTPAAEAPKVPPTPAPPHPTHTHVQAYRMFPPVVRVVRDLEQ